MEINDKVIVTQCDHFLGYTGVIKTVSKQIFGEDHLYYVAFEDEKIAGGEYYSSEIQKI